jgi:PAS domain S-box-containing protein
MADPKGNPTTPVRSSVDDGTMPASVYRTLVQSVRDYAIFALDTKGNVRSWNEGALQIKGYKPSEIIGKHFSIFYPEIDRARDKPGWELRVALQEGRFEDEGWRVRADGTQFWANVIITTLYDAQGEHIGFGKVTRDLTERRQAQERAIEDARRVAEAEASNRAKGEFLAAMSHELRTPLNAIGGYIDLLAMAIGGPVSPEQMQYLERVRRSQKHLLAIISDLLNFSRIEAGQVSYDIQPFEVQRLVEAVRPLIEPQAAARGVHFEKAAIPPGTLALGDARKVEQVLLNLLSNAVKFTESGGTVRVDVHLNDRQVVVNVIDTGRGIPTDKHEAIFEPFVQLGRTLTSTHEGTGLGLAISRDLARAMAGDITVRSEPGSGSTFSLFLPRADR